MICWGRAAARNSTGDRGPERAILTTHPKSAIFAPEVTTLVKIHRKGQMTLPSRLRSAVGVAEGDLVEASVQRGKIVLTPTTMIDRSKFPNADDEYTPAQRRIIDARLVESDEDVKKGRVYGPFTAKGAARFLKAELKARSKKTNSGR